MVKDSKFVIEYYEHIVLAERAPLPVRLEQLGDVYSPDELTTLLKAQPAKVLRFTDASSYLTPTYMTEGYEIKYVFEGIGYGNESSYLLAILPENEDVNMDDPKTEIYKKGGVTISVGAHVYRDVDKSFNTRAEYFNGTTWKEDDKLYFETQDGGGFIRVQEYDKTKEFLITSLSYYFPSSETLKIIKSLGPDTETISAIPTTTDIPITGATTEQQ